MSSVRRHSLLSAITEIGRPASDVFRFVCDWRNYESLWGKAVQIRAPESLAGTRLGQVTELTHSSGNVVMHAIATVTRFEESRLVAWDTSFPRVIDAGRVKDPNLPNFLVVCEFDEHEARTRLKVSLKLHGKCPAAMRLILMVVMLFQHRTLAKGLRTIKAQLES